MNRRKFFNILGSAVIGTVIALKIPESIAPIKFDLYDEYKKCAGSFEYWYKNHLRISNISKQMYKLSYE